ncbi:MAG: transposase [Pyrinomonadaceae bacterium]
MPIGFHLIAKTEKYVDQKTEKEKRRSPVTKNEVALELIGQAVKNHVPFRFVLFDSWFSSKENMMKIKGELQKDFICPIKTNRKVAMSLADKLKGQFPPSGHA